MTGQGFGAVRPLPGDGLVAYLGGLLLVCDAAEAAADELLKALRETAAAGGDGRALASRAAQVLAANMTGDPATCAVAGPVDSGVAVLVSGSAVGHDHHGLRRDPAGRQRLADLGRPAHQRAGPTRLAEPARRRRAAPRASASTAAWCTAAGWWATSVTSPNGPRPSPGR